MPRRDSLRPKPKSKQRKEEPKSTKNIRSFLGDDSATEESSETAPFLSADLDDQTDYGLDFTTSPRSSRRTNLTRSIQQVPDKLPTGPASRQAKNPTKTKKKPRKQLNPEQRDLKFLKTVQRLQMGTGNLVPKAPFCKIIREILIQQSTTADRLTLTALVALQEASEMYLIQLFQDAYCCTLHRGRVTLNVKDIELTRFLRGPSDPGNR